MLWESDMEVKLYITIIKMWVCVLGLRDLTESVARLYPPSEQVKS